jgi:hypothetical protein
MKEAILFWLARYAADAIVALAILVVVVVSGLLFILPGLVRQMRCKHDRGVHETWACDAICRECGKNLGFIGAWREAEAKKKAPGP